MFKGYLKPSLADKRLFSRRLWWVRTIVLLGFVVLITRLLWLQIYQHRHYQELSTNNRVRAQFLAPTRGRILDREGKIIASNRAAFALEVLPESAGEIDALIEEIQNLIQLSEVEVDSFYRRLEKSNRTALETVILKSNMSVSEVAIISSQLYRLDGLSIQNFLQRVYPEGKVNSTFIGYTGQMNERELDSADPNLYSRSSYTGKTGLELEYESQLYGAPGYSYAEVDAHGRIRKELHREPAMPGMDLRTTISLTLQKQALELLDGYKGAVVALDPRTGEVISLYSAPSFDNNKRAELTLKITPSDAVEENFNPLFNRAINGMYPPASTIKPFLATHPNLNEFLPNSESLMCKGHFRVGNRTFRDWKRFGHGEMDLIQAISQSCDVFFYQVGLFLGWQEMNNALSRFGYGRKTDIDLPGESDGLLPTEEWKLKVYKESWQPGDSANMSIGQGFLLATPLQMAVATARLANRGRAVTPRLFLDWQSSLSDVQIEDPGTPEVDQASEIEQPVSAPLVDSSEQLPEQRRDRLNEVLEGMRQVIHSENGTARANAWRFKGLGIEGAGKTGTAQVVRILRDELESDEPENEKLRDHSLFIGFAPFDDPQIAVVVVVENGGDGSKVAAPIATKLMLSWLKEQSIESETASE